MEHLNLLHLQQRVMCDENHDVDVDFDVGDGGYQHLLTKNWGLDVDMITELFFFNLMCCYPNQLMPLWK